MSTTIGTNSGIYLDDIEAVRLIYNFKKKYKNDSTYAIHLTIENLENILKEIKTLDGLDKFGNGVTLYVGEYSDNYSPSQDPQNADYSNRMTLVAVPTYGETLEGSYVDFMDAATVLDCKQKIDDGEKIVDSSAGLNQTRALNHFKLCPPDAGCSVNNVIWENL